MLSDLLPKTREYKDHKWQDLDRGRVLKIKKNCLAVSGFPSDKYLEVQTDKEKKKDRKNS